MRLLFITANRLGDAVLSTGILNALIERHPGIAVTVAGGKLATPLFASVPGLERSIDIDKRPLDLHWPKLWSEVIGRRWDLVVDLRSSGIGYLLWARQRITAGRADLRQHRVVELGKLLDLSPPPPPRLWISQEKSAEAELLFGSQTPVLALAPVANWTGKAWPAERFVDLALRLTGERGPLAGSRIAVFASEAERMLAAPVIDGLPEDRVLDLVGRIDLPLVAACLARASFFVGNDSGLMHLAAAAGTPTLGLFGPSSERRYAPWGAKAAFVRTEESFEELDRIPKAHGQASLMTSLSVVNVEAAAQNLWSKIQAAR